MNVKLGGVKVEKVTSEQLELVHQFFDVLYGDDVDAYWSII